MLRALSRTAMALRVVRILINLRKARRLSGNVAETLRSAVSQNRRRYLPSYIYVWMYLYIYALNPNPYMFLQNCMHACVHACVYIYMYV